MSDENIVPLRPGLKADQEQAAFPVVTGTHPGVILALEDLLERARRGEVVGLTCTYQGPDWRSAYYVVGHIGGFSMVGAAQCALQELTDVARGFTSDDDG